ncbi:MAG: ATP synthase subunit b, sodium ion specific [Parcubacteria bacterium OLB19]|nr:MAG: ATP synthase subunit b, sodium ion specific [Parcubacteria bacterium OLB19]
MEQMIEAFGIDTRLIFVQILNFGLLVLVLTYLLYKPILNILNERQEKILKGINDAKEAEMIRRQVEEDRNRIIGEANKEAGIIVLRAKDHAKEKAERIIDEAGIQVEKMLSEALIHGDELKAKALREAEAEISKLAILMAEKILKERG